MILKNSLLKKVEKAFIKQHDFSDCGACCLLSIIKYYEGDSSLEYIKDISGTHKEGTSLLGLYEASIKEGFESKGVEISIDFLKKIEEPIILHCIIDNKFQHFIVVYKFIKNKGFLISDPAIGVEVKSEEELNKIWKSKYALILKEKNVIKKKRKEKFEWIKDHLYKYKSILILSSIIGIAISFINISLALFSQKLIDDILPNKNIYKLISGVILLSIILIINNLLSFFRSKLLIIFNKMFSIQLNHFFIKKIVYTPKRFFDKRRIGDFTSRLNDLNKINNSIIYFINSFIIDILTLIISLIIIYIYDDTLGIMCLFFTPLYIYTLYFFNKNVYNKQLKVSRDFSSVESQYINTIKGINEIKNYKKENKFIDINILKFANFQNSSQEYQLYNLKLNTITSFINNIFLISFISIISYYILNDFMKVGVYIAIITILSNLLLSMKNISLAIIPYSDAKVSFDRMYEMINIKNEEDICENYKKIDSFLSIEFKNVYFNYAGSLKTLSNISFKIKKGQLLLIYGKSGIGKSTIVQLIKKNYHILSGSILINDHDLYSIDDYNLNDLCSIVQQDTYVFEGTVLDNILLSNSEDNIDMINLNLFVNRFKQLIDYFPQGLNTYIGDTGIKLSGGQSKLLSLLRALYKDAPLIIMDEPTTGMDNKLEEEVINIIEEIKLKNNKTIILITHNLNVFKKISDSLYEVV